VTCAISERRIRDLEGCAALLAQVHVTQRYPIRWPDDPRAWLTPPDVAGAWVATRDDEVIGHVCLVRKDLVLPELTLERLFVSPDVAGSGVGRALINHASDWAAERRSRLTLNVAENCAKAITLYGRLGWRLTGRTPIDWGDDAADSLLHFEAPTC
jgi:GNAT superfamily N-acetyltransferase